jgi:predicted nucleic acid-binding protein
MGDLTTLFDTSALIGSGGPLPALDGQSAVSVVAIGELYAGVLLAAEGSTQSKRLRRLATVLSDATVLDVDRYVATAFGDLRSVTGRPQSNDLWIAATALAHDLTLVTRDTQQAALPMVRTQLV